MYSASLYRNMEHKGDVSAVFSIFPNSPFYIKVFVIMITINNYYSLL